MPLVQGAPYLRSRVSQWSFSFHKGTYPLRVQYMYINLSFRVILNKGNPPSIIGQRLQGTTSQNGTSLSLIKGAYPLRAHTYLSFTGISCIRGHLSQQYLSFQATLNMRGDSVMSDSPDLGLWGITMQLPLYQGLTFIRGHFSFHMGVDHLRLYLCHSLVLYRKLCFMIRGDPQKWLLHLYILCFHCHALRNKKANRRVVTKISSFWVNTISRQGVKQLGISFGSIFLLFSNKYIYMIYQLQILQ